MDPITLHYQLNWGQIHDLFKGGGEVIPIRPPNYTLIYFKTSLLLPKNFGSKEVRMNWNLQHHKLLQRHKTEEMGILYWPKRTHSQENLLVGQK